ncbi:MAG: family 3 adenylate cyclase [Elusimicrobia bacterium]|nr:MAG: family 3 adenylate cyclase [Elusimicrobiota bacterium]KAF0156033.1 MAG: family 3 adenylate cyclase [Elusimicrobiota bacterium]
MKNFSRMALKICVFSSALILAVMAAMAHILLEASRSALLGEMSLRAEAFSRSAREAFIPSLDVFSLHLAVNAMTRERAIAGAVVTDTAGRVLSHSLADMVGEQDPSPEGAAARAAEGMTVTPSAAGGWYIAAPVSTGAGRAATAAIVLTPESLAEALAPMRRKVLYVTLAALAAALAGTIAIVSWLMRPIPMLARAAREVGEGKLDTEVVWKSSDEIGVLAGAFNDMVKGLRERDHIRSVFGRYVSGEIADAVLGGKLPLGGERRHIAVIFADIRDFSAMGQRDQPEAVVKLLNDYFTLMTRVIRARGGIVDKFLGDGLLAMFGAPLASANPEERAVHAALEMRWTLSAFNAHRVREGLAPVAMGLCVTSGPALVGNIGSEEKMEYTAIGEPVNLASRLEGINKRLGTSAIVSRAVREATAAAFQYKELGAHAVRGWKDPLDLFELLDPGSAPRQPVPLKKGT